MNGAFFALRQVLLACSNELHPCNGGATGGALGQNGTSAIRGGRMPLAHGGVEMTNDENNEIGEEMTRMVNCVVLGSEEPGMERAPYPGELGQRIFNTVSEQGWKDWLQRQTTIINENGLSTVDPASLALIELHMIGFLFKEGDLGQLPDGFKAAGAK